MILQGGRVTAKGDAVVPGPQDEYEGIRGGPARVLILIKGKSGFHSMQVPFSGSSLHLMDPQAVEPLDAPRESDGGNTEQ